MQKKLMIITLVIVIFVAAIATFFFVRSSSNKPAAQAPLPTPVSLAPSETLKDYQDPAGFVFSYPDDVTVTPKESTSSAVYSHLEITSSKTEGKIDMEVADTKFKTTDAFLKDRNISTMSATIAQKKLGELDAVEIVETNKTTLATVDQGILFLITSESTAEKEYWNTVYSTIVSSFAFNSPTQAPQDTSSSVDLGGEDVILEEEVVE